MTEDKKFVPRAPDFKGDGVAVWLALDKNDKTYLKVSILGNKAINCFKLEEEPKEKPKPTL